MIDSAKIMKLCNDIEDIVTDMDVHCDAAGWEECKEIFSKIKQIGEELNERHGHWNVVQEENSSKFIEAHCSICGYEPQCEQEEFGEMLFCPSCGHMMDDANGEVPFDYWNNPNVVAVFYTPEEWKRRAEDNADD